MRSDRSGEHLWKRVFTAAGLLGLAAWLMPGPLGAALTVEQLYAARAPSMVIVEATDEGPQAKKSQGSGVVIAPAQVVTNCHVLGDHPRLQVRVRSDETPYATERLLADPDRDLCQLRVPGLHAPAVPLGRSADATVGQPVYAIGAPQGLAQTLSEGVVSAVRTRKELEDLGLLPPKSLKAQLEDAGNMREVAQRGRGHPPARYLQTTASISPGSSGGGLFDAEGRLLGITTFLVKDGQNLNFAIPVEWLYDLPADLRASRLRETQRTSTPGAKAPPDAADSETSRRAAHKMDTDYARRLPALTEAKDYQGAQDLMIEWLAHLAAQTIDPDRLSTVAAALSVSSIFAYNASGETVHARSFAKPLIPLAKAMTRRMPPKDRPVAWHILAHAYAKLALYDQAVTADRQAIGLCELHIQDSWDTCSTLNRSSFWSSLGSFYDRMGNLVGVREAYQALKRLDAKQAETFYRTYLTPPTP